MVEADAKVIGIIADGQLIDALDEIGHEQPVIVVLDKTPFYGEMGGQVGDVGEISARRAPLRGRRARPSSTASSSTTGISARARSAWASVTARVDEARRQAIRRAHSATHLLHLALHEHVGKHALQQGSKVDADLLRFDFANPKGLTAEQLAAVEDEVNRLVMAGLPVTCKNLPLAEARKLGAMMLFGEKYPDVVRVVAWARARSYAAARTWTTRDRSGLLKIVAEESVAAGVRRITAADRPGRLGARPPHRELRWPRPRRS